MKKYFLILLVITPLYGGRRSAGMRLRYGIKSPPSSAKKKSTRPATPFPPHVIEEDDDDEYYGLYFPQQAAPPIPESSTLLQRRKNKKPFKPDHKKPLPPIERPVTRLYKKRTSCTNCTVSYCQGQGWCPEHKRLIHGTHK